MQKYITKFISKKSNKFLPKINKSIKAFYQDLLVNKKRSIFFGDSVLLRVSDFDHDKTPLYETIRKNFSSFAVAAAGGFTCKSFYYILIIVSFFLNIKKIIVPLNYRSFSSSWWYNPKFQFNLLSSLIGISCKPSSSCLHHYKKIMTTFINNGKKLTLEELVSTSVGRERFIDRKKALFHAFYKIPEIKRAGCYKYFLKLCKLCIRKKINLIFYSTPINVDGIKALLGPQACVHIQNQLKSLFMKRDLRKIKYLNLSFKLQSKNFFSLYEVNEHLNQNGRRFLISSLKPYLHNDGICSKKFRVSKK